MQLRQASIKLTPWASSRSHSGSSCSLCSRMAEKLASRWRDVRKCVVQRVRSAKLSKFWSRSAETVAYLLMMKANGTNSVASWPERIPNLRLNTGAPVSCSSGTWQFFCLDFLFVVLGCWDVGHDKREIPFLWEWSFCFQGNSFYPFSIRSGVSHLFLRMASRERRFPFLTKFSAVCHYGSCFLLFFLPAFLLLL